MSKSSNKKKHNKAQANPQNRGELPPTPKKTRFKNFAELAAYAKGMVYLIVRLREKEGVTYFRSLGTGFLAGRGRMVTCNHCLVDDDSTDDMLKHKDGDLYMFVQKDEYDTFHRYGIVANENTELFLYPDIDIAVFHLSDDFYRVDGEYYKHPDMYLELGADVMGIGTDISVIGYPFPELSFDDEGNPDISAVRIRGDQGVVNTAYTNNGYHAYEFTTAFNPGNSGGPIFDTKTGVVIAVVLGYHSTPLRCIENTVPAGTGGHTQEETHHTLLHTHYSIGNSVQNLQTVAATHGLAVRKTT